MTLKEVKEGSIVILDQKKLAKLADGVSNERLRCSGKYGAALYKTKHGTVIQNTDQDENGTLCYLYDMYMETRGLLICCNERLVIDTIGAATVTFHWLADKNAAFWLGVDEFEAMPFICANTTD